MGSPGAIDGLGWLWALVQQMPVYLSLVIAWVTLLVFFCWHAATHPMPFGKKVDFASLMGAGLQLFSFWGLWLDHRRAGLPEHWVWWVKVIIGVFGVSVVCASVWWIVWSTRTLGEHWTLEARVVGPAELVTRGAYGVVRHPIYVGFWVLLCLTLLTVGRPLSAWVFLVAYAVGMGIRVRLEDRLLAGVFGERFEAYRRKVPGLVPGWVR